MAFGFRSKTVQVSSEGKECPLQRKKTLSIQFYLFRTLMTEYDDDSFTLSVLGIIRIG